MNFQNFNSQYQYSQQSRPPKIQFINSNILKKPNLQSNVTDKTIQNQKQQNTLTSNLAQQQQSQKNTSNQVQYQMSNLNQGKDSSNYYQKQSQNQKEFNQNYLNNNNQDKKNQSNIVFEQRNLSQNTKIKITDVSTTYQNPNIKIIARSSSQVPSNNQIQQNSNNEQKKTQQFCDFTCQSQPIQKESPNINYFNQNIQNDCLPERKSKNISYEIKQDPKKLQNQYQYKFYNDEIKNCKQNEQENYSPYPYSHHIENKKIGEINDYQMSDYNNSSNYHKKNNSDMNNKFNGNCLNYPTHNNFECSKPQIQYYDQIGQENKNQQLAYKPRVNQDVDLYESICRDFIFKCERCQNPIEGTCAQLKCYHSYHQQCLEELIQNQINQQFYQPIKCICGTKISEATLKYQLNLNNYSELMQKYYQAQLLELFYQNQRKLNIQACNICNFFCISNRSQKQFQCYQHQ